MDSKNTFRILFWLNKAKLKDARLPIYARVTVNGRRAEISLSRYFHPNDWDERAHRIKGRSPEATILNNYLDAKYAKLLQCYEDLLKEDKVITARGIKARFLGADASYKTLIDVIEHHSTTMGDILKWGTLKNYGATEKYLRDYMVKDHSYPDIYLKNINYQFITGFEKFLRRQRDKNGKKQLSNNGIMKHMVDILVMLTPCTGHTDPSKDLGQKDNLMTILQFFSKTFSFEFYSMGSVHQSV